MTSHYIDVSLRPDIEISEPHLLGALYNRFHLALVKKGIDNIGISFPKYSLSPLSLGELVRIHSDEGSLRDLMKDDWLKGMREHVRLSTVMEAPQASPHRVVQRKQFKTNAERLRRRRMRRLGTSYEEAVSAIPTSVERRPDLPYVQLHSQSTGHPFCLFVSLGPLMRDAMPGTFNSYGLSAGGTVPWF